MLRWAVMAIGLVLSLQAHALTFEELSGLTDQSQTLSGQFEQQKYLQQLDTSIHSRGKFQISSNEIHWHTIDPIDDELVVTPEGIQGAQQVSAQANAMIVRISQIFFAVLRADWTAVSPHFELSGEQHNGQWQIELIPIDQALSQGVDKIKAAGARGVEQVTIFEKSGDRLDIRFHTQRP